MSRIVVKNLPKHITSERLKNVFQAKGSVTDLQLKYTKDGKFRQFAFIGYRTEEEATAAKEYFHNTYLDTSKIQVETWAPLGDASKPRAWSKYSKESSAHQKKEEENSVGRPTKVKKPKNEEEGVSLEVKSSNKKHLKENDEKLSEDPKFFEFLEVSKTSLHRPVWSNDATGVPTEISFPSDRDSKKQAEKSKILLNEDENDDDELATERPENTGRKTKKKKEKVKNKEKPDTNRTKDLSDMDFLKTKVVKSLEPDDDKDDNNDVTKDGESGKESEDEAKELKSKAQPNFDNKFTIKLRGLPYACTKKDVRHFLLPLRPLSLRVPAKVKGIAYAKFKTEKEVRQALNKHRGFINGHRISVIKYVPKCNDEKEAAVVKWNKDLEDDPQYEEVGESGRIFARNLSYIVTEEDLEKLFGIYGPLAEVHLPVDRISRKVKGFAFITYVLPEHATKALSELDGTPFQGRILHLIPAKSKETAHVEIPEDIAFKRKKEVKLKALSGSSHNWNALFLGSNAVADVMTEKYNLSKAQLLDTETRDSVAVRMALGETQIVTETREFLLKHNVQLDAFGQPATERSKTVILVKNLPARTRAEDIRELFEKHGEVSQVILPPSGITAIVEFQAPAEARAAFKKLAYSKFYHVPLYLEWAPVDVFKSREENTEEDEYKKGVSESQEVNPENDEEEEEEEEPEPGTTLFVKNLNFETTDENLRKLFEKCGTVHSVTIAKKKDGKNPGKLLSMGYGFVQYKTKQMAQAALKELQHAKLDSHALELKVSERALVAATGGRKTPKLSKQKTTKILVRNLPFEAKLSEVKQLFSVFGELKAVRLPKKLDGSSRGFAFVDFLSKNNAKRAFNSLCNSTHFYGRRLNLEWAKTEDDNVELLQQKTRRYFDGEGSKPKHLKSKDLLSSLDNAVKD